MQRRKSFSAIFARVTRRFHSNATIRTIYVWQSIRVWWLSYFKNKNVSDALVTTINNFRRRCLITEFHILRAIKNIHWSGYFEEVVIFFLTFTLSARLMPSELGRGTYENEYFFLVWNANVFILFKLPSVAYYYTSYSKWWARNLTRINLYVTYGYSVDEFIEKRVESVSQKWSGLETFFFSTNPSRGKIYHVTIH